MSKRHPKILGISKHCGICLKTDRKQGVKKASTICWNCSGKKVLCLGFVTKNEKSTCDYS